MLVSATFPDDVRQVAEEPKSRKRQYQEYIDSDHWKALRKQAFEVYGSKCGACDGNQLLHVHHIRYLEFYNCTTLDLAVLCEECHYFFHLAAKILRFDYIGVELPEIKQKIVDARTNNKFLAKLARREKKLEARKAKPQTPEQPKQPKKSKSRKRRINAEYQKMRAAHFSNESIQSCVELLNQILSAMPPKPPVLVEVVLPRTIYMHDEITQSL